MVDLEKKEPVALYDIKKFFELSIADEYMAVLTPLITRDQPTAFFDDDREIWIAVLDDNGWLMRQKI